MPECEEIGRDPVEEWQLTLYVAGMTPADQRALANLREICEAHLPGRHRIEVLDILEHPDRADEDQIFAVPTLVRRVPSPWRKVIGDLSDRTKALAGIDLAGLGGEGDH